jgi:hypothetical protein
MEDEGTDVQPVFRALREREIEIGYWRFLFSTISRLHMLK